ncbi:hypothetical protein GCM10011297_24420 [Bacterioplanes sanyensis]|uniref:hypothetical protein n=1 Tax=Bacterioplanes sanyensis TaxID=1249553 RepID=UPI0016736972|nr:hypothetical protein [Bacterioplanes sanyensis]GGY50664.1 hypothetical protein GCM10011297_24420 [Bacterioplanes sanyensis]
MKVWITLCLLALLSGCVSLNSVSMTQVPAQRSNQVTTSADHWSLLGIAFSNDFVDEAMTGLQQQCQGGKLEGVYTKYQNTLYLLILQREVIVSGYCNRS